MRGLWVLGLAAVLLGVRGYSFATNVHHDQFLPFFWKLLDPAAFPNDPYPATGAYYPSLFIPLGALCLKLGMSLATLMGLTYGLMVLGLASGIAAFADAAFESTAAKLLGSFLILCCEFLNAQSFFGEDALFRSYADPSGMAWALILWALAFWLRGRKTGAFVLLGLAADITPLPVLHVGLVLGASELIGDPRKGFERMLKPAAAFGAAALPILIAIARMPKQPPVDAALVFETLKTWFPFHYFPETWPAGKWLTAFAYTALYGSLLLRAPAASRKKLLPLAAGSLAVVCLGFLARVSGSSLLLRLQWFRADLLLILAGLLLTAEQAWLQLSLGTLRGFLLGALLLSTVTVWFCWPLALAAALVLLAGESVGRYGAWAVAFLAAAWSLDRGSRGEPAFFPPVPAMALFVAAPLMLLRDRKLGSLRLPALGLLVVIFLPILWLLGLRTGGLSNINTESQQTEQEWMELMDWCGRSTPADSLFLINPDTAGFRALARRSVVFEWVDGAALHWMPAYATVWQERFRDMHGSPERLGAQWQRVSEAWHPVLWSPGRRQNLKDLSLTLGGMYDTFGDADFKGILKKHAADYIITRVEAPRLSFRLLREGPNFRLYSTR